jgi:hypothetical protein
MAACSRVRMAYSGERLPRVQQVRRSAHGAAGSGLPGGADTPGRTGRPAAGTDAGSRAHAPALRAAGLASASRREAAHGCAPGAVRRMRSAKPFAPRSFCAWRAQRRSHNASGPPASAGGARSARARAGVTGDLPVGWHHQAEPRSRRAKHNGGPSSRPAAADRRFRVTDCGSGWSRGRVQIIHLGAPAGSRQIAAGRACGGSSRVWPATVRTAVISGYRQPAPAGSRER